MACDQELADRVGLAFERAGAATVVKKMMGGLCFMVDGKMCLGVESERLMARIGPDAYESALERPGCAPMDFTGRPMKGFVYVDMLHLKTDGQIDFWVQLALAYNPQAKASRKKKTG